MKRIAMLFALAVVVVAAASAVWGQPSASKGTDAKSMDMKSMEMRSSNKNAAVHSAIGVVKGVDPAAGSITLAHEPIKSLNWPAMSMSFKVEDKALLDKAKQGEKVQFSFVQSGNEYVITSIKSK